MVKKNSITLVNEKILFIITDFKSEINVIFAGTVPNLFQEEKGVVAEGFLEDKNLFIADKILAKHDENYMPQSAIDKLKEEKDVSIKWRHYPLHPRIPKEGLKVKDRGDKEEKANRRVYSEHLENQFQTQGLKFVRRDLISNSRMAQELAVWADSQDAENKAVSETTNAWSKYQSSESVLIATESQLKAAEIANEGITLEYDSGNTRTTLEVIQSRSLLLDSRIAFAKAERDFIISKFELAFQLGTLSSSSIKSL